MTNQYNNNTQQQKKVYSMEDNIKYISFGIKDLVKEIQNLNLILSSMKEKNSDEKENLF